MLGADLLGFHTHDYVQYFLRSVFRTLGHEHTFGQLAVGGDIRRAEAFPIGIDFDRFSSATETQEVISARSAVKRGIGDRKVVFSVDRLDYSKGLLHRLRGYEMLLELNPQWRQRVVYVLAVVPSREEVAQYQRMKQDLDELVGQINGKYGGVDWVPIIYQYRTLEFPDLVALYSLADVALITPLRDGMNLVAKEYLACKSDGTGVLILSEMAGAARELGEALHVNPNHKEEIAASLNEALNMPSEDQIRRNRPMRERLKSYDAAHWVNAFLNALGRVKARQGALATRHLRGEAVDRVLERHTKAGRRLVFLDYDGTLVPFAPQPHLAAPDPALLRLIGELASSKAQRVCVISGRDQSTLLDWFRDLPVHLIGEHGAWIRRPGEAVEILKPISADWKQHIRPLLQLYVDRVPGSLLEEKQFSLAWHYRRSDPEHGALRAKELIDDITAFTANFDVQVIEGKKVVEIRNGGVNKGAAAMHCIAAYEPDFVFAAGDDATDEDLFRALPATAVTVRVGNSQSHATYRVRDHRELRELLEQMAANPMHPQPAR
jgi:trehalose 6-phosphate synthase/phosphatase